MGPDTSWAYAFWLAVLLASIPLGWIYRILQRLPRPVLLSHRPWPGWANMTLILAVTGSVSLFIHTAYDSLSRAGSLGVVAIHFLITALVYVFGVVLMLRQFVGLYPEYFVATGQFGLSIRKALYRNIQNIEPIRESPGETELRVSMRSGEQLLLDLPARDVSVFYEIVKESQPKL